MKISVVAACIPQPEGTAAGRDLWAWCEGMLALGHDVEAWVWHRPVLAPEGPLPAWARYDPVLIPPSLSSHARALLHPRVEPTRTRWRPPPDAVAVADHLPSASAVLGHPRSVVTLHYRTWADVRAVHRLQLSDVQDIRAERRAWRRAELVLAYSQRVGRRGAQPAHVVPIAYPIPDKALEPVEEPVAALMADWSWRPNRLALSSLLAAWPEVRGAVPGARLLLGGRNLATDLVGSIAGVEIVGPVARTSDVLGRAAVVAFPCPNSSGPKVKSLEALAHGLPVVTTTAGAEGLAFPEDSGPMVGDERSFARRLAELLADPERRLRLGRAGRAAVSERHSGKAAAEARVAAFAKQFGV